MIRAREDERVTIEFDDTTRAWNDWKHGNLVENSLVHERYTVSLVECTKMYTTRNSSLEISTSGPLEIPALVRTVPERSGYCHICRKSRGQLHPCRVCEKVYHQQCIQDIGETKSYNWIKNANNLIGSGWSCPICEDLRVLLPPDELAETNDWIKSLGAQAISNLHSYIHTRLKSKSPGHLSQLTVHMKSILRTFLNTIPDTTPNRLSQPDLFTLDLCWKILRTPAKSLVHSLTQFELHRLSEFFLSFASVDRQCVTYQKFDQIVHRYLQRAMPELNSDEEQLHLEALAHTFFGRSLESNRTWSQFLLDASIPTLLGRLNHRTSVELTKRSTSPSTADYRDGQSVSVLIRNVLQKLTQNQSEPVQDQYRNKSIDGRRKRRARSFPRR